MGMSRSATMVIMYLMRKYEIESTMAFDIVKSRREIIDPNLGFRQILQNYEGRQYRLRRTITIKEDETIEEKEELSEFSGCENSDSEEEDVMAKKCSFEFSN